MKNKPWFTGNSRSETFAHRVDYKRKMKMMGHIVRYPDELHSTILKGMIEGKVPPGRPLNTFIGQVKKYPEIGSYRVLKELTSSRESWRRNVAN